MVDESPQGRRKYQELIASVADLPDIPTAVAHPCRDAALEGAVAAAAASIIAPILVGPRARILEVAARTDARLVASSHTPGGEYTDYPTTTDGIASAINGPVTTTGVSCRCSLVRGSIRSSP